MPSNESNYIERFPSLSEFDPETSKEGTIDPLGLYPIADYLGTRLAPGIRERQKHPRFLTAIVVGDVLCAALRDPDAVAKDDESLAWQVYEWYVVEGLVRRLYGTGEIRGLPGQDKVRNALHNDIPLSAKQYLKTPTVFGFHGVYRALATNLRLEQDSRLEEAGVELVTAWEKDQDLPGFLSAVKNGCRIKNRLVDAIQRGLDQGFISQNNTWDGWDFMEAHLAPRRIGRNERQVLRKALLGNPEDLRRELIEFFCSPRGKQVWSKTESEKDLHTALMKVSSAALGAILDTIQIYESFARYLTDAFEDALALLAQRGGAVSVTELAKMKSVDTAVKALPRLYPQVLKRLAPIQRAVEFEDRFHFFSEKYEAAEFVLALMEHHRRIQKNKPPQPEGRSPWVSETGKGQFFLRLHREFGGKHDGSYVHAYRGNSVWSFLTDLKMV